jgi:hypothetical protein
VGLAAGSFIDRHDRCTLLRPWIYAGCVAKPAANREDLRTRDDVLDLDAPVSFGGKA